VVIIQQKSSVRTMKKKLYRGGIFTFDFCIVLIIFIFLVYYSLLIINSIKEKILEEKREITKYKLYQVSERIVKRDLAKTDGKITYSNLFEEKNLNFSSYKELGINYLEVNSNLFNFKEGKECTEIYCIERLVIKDGIKKVKICIC
jgi:hypothetical protein